MTTQHKKPSNAALHQELLSCAVCKEQIPVDEALSDEAAGYVFHLCGAECYAEWQAGQTETPDDDR